MVRRLGLGLRGRVNQIVMLTITLTLTLALTLMCPYVT